MKNIPFKIALCLLPACVFGQTEYKNSISVPTLVQGRYQTIVIYNDYENSCEGLLWGAWDPTDPEPWRPMTIDTNIYRIVSFTGDEIGMEFRKLTPSMQLYQSAFVYGGDIAPDYKTANCTELMTGLLSEYYNLTVDQKKQINIVIPGTTAAQIIRDLKAGRDKPAYGGVCHFVEANNYGSRIHYWEDVLPGDLVQWWWFAGNSGHCGIVKEVNKKERWFSVYSSTPGQGFGVTRYPIDFDAHFYFARITATQKTP